MEEKYTGVVYDQSLRLEKVRLKSSCIFECIYQHLSISKAAESLYTPHQP